LRSIGILSRFFLPAFQLVVSQPKSQSSATPHVALIAVQLMFATWPIVGKVALRVVPSASLVAFRVAGAALAFLLIGTIRGRVGRIHKRDWLLLIASSLLGVVLNQWLFVKGLSLTTVINATLLGTTIPITNLARFFALSNGITISSTIDRLVAVKEAGALDAETAAALTEAFQIVMRMRLDHQAEQIEAGAEPNNVVDPAALRPLTRTQLREVFRAIVHAQKRLSVYVPMGM